MRWVGHVALWGEKRCLRGFMGKPEGKRPLGRTRRILKDNMVLQEVGWGLVWLRVGTGGGLSWMRGISWLAEDLLASQGGLCCLELEFSCPMRVGTNSVRFDSNKFIAFSGFCPGAPNCRIISHNLLSTVRLNFLKMASMVAETRRSENWHVI